jgi:SAM-dependent methyltransferase
MSEMHADTSDPGPALVQSDQPWGDAALAQLYDLFPFEGDLPLYLELAAREGGSVLEPACGSGRVLLPLVRAGNRVTGIDASPHMLQITRRKLAAAGRDAESRANLIQGDMRDFDVPGQFDFALIAVKSFAYLTKREDQQRTLSAIHRHLRPGGLLALDLMNPSLEWLMQPPGSLRQDLVQRAHEQGITLARTEAEVSTDLAEQIRVIRSGYEIVRDDGSVTRRFVEWPYRYMFRFEAEHLLERSGYDIEALYGGYEREPFTSESRLMLFLARKTGT